MEIKGVFHSFFIHSNISILLTLLLKFYKITHHWLNLKVDGDGGTFKVKGKQNFFVNCMNIFNCANK